MCIRDRLWVVGLASLMAIFLQIIAARVGIATGRDLAQCCYDWYPKWTRVPNWLMAELAIIACDLAEVLGGAVALLMLFHIPIFWGVIITGVDVLLLLAMQRFGMRTIEAIVPVSYTHLPVLRKEQKLKPPHTTEPVVYVADGRGAAAAKGARSDAGVVTPIAAPQNTVTPCCHSCWIGTRWLSVGRPRCV